MKQTIFILFALGLASYTLHQESQLGKTEYNKYYLSSRY